MPCLKRTCTDIKRHLKTLLPIPPQIDKPIMSWLIFILRKTFGGSMILATIDLYNWFIICQA